MEEIRSGAESCRAVRSLPMKRCAPVIAVILGVVSAAWSAPPAPLTSLPAIHALSNSDAATGLPVAFEATVTYYRGYENTLFVQDGDAAIYVWAAADPTLIPGDRVLVKGTTQGSFRPSILGKEIVFLRHGTLPKPKAATFDELIRTEDDCMLVKVHAVVRAADLERHANLRNTGLPMVTSTLL